MIPFIHKSLQLIYKKFNLVWIFLTLILLFSFLYINWQLNKEKSSTAISYIAQDLAKRIDNLVGNISENLHISPNDKTKVSDCKSKIYPQLERILLNKPKISGLIMSENGKILCSTLPHDMPINLKNNQKSNILGPYVLPFLKEPAYLFGQKVGLLDLHLLILATTLEEALNFTDEQAGLIILMNEKDNKPMLTLQYHQTQWVINNNATPNPNTPFKSTNLESITGIDVYVYENTTMVLHQLIIHELLIGFIIILFSYMLYSLVKNFISERYSLVNAMKAGVKNDEFYPEYHPIIDREQNIICGAELLLRWRNNQEQLIMPDFFIQEAEATGLIIPITLRLLDISFKQMGAILRQYPQFHLAINICSLHFIDPLFFHQFTRIIKQHDISPHQIILEITERGLLDKGNDAFLTKMEDLRDAGFSLAIDDYGTGHTSISYLQTYPFNYLKIDQLFIQAIGTHAITESLNQTIINMAKKLNLTIIAEGVETQEQEAFLIKHGIRFMQGWYFSREINAKELARLLKEEHHEGKS